MDKYSELARLLRKNGWEKQGGTNHEKWVKDGKTCGFQGTLNLINTRLMIF